MVVASETALPLVMVPASEFNKENGVIWAASPDRLELPAKQFHHSNCSDSPCVSESGSDIFSKREKPSDGILSVCDEERLIIFRFNYVSVSIDVTIQSADT